MARSVHQVVLDRGGLVATVRSLVHVVAPQLAHLEGDLWRLGYDFVPTSFHLAVPI